MDAVEGGTHSLAYVRGIEWFLRLPEHYTPSEEEFVASDIPVGYEDFFLTDRLLTQRVLKAVGGPPLHTLRIFAAYGLTEHGIVKIPDPQSDYEDNDSLGSLSDEEALGEAATPQHGVGAATASGVIATIAPWLPRDSNMELLAAGLPSGHDFESIVAAARGVLRAGVNARRHWRGRDWSWQEECAPLMEAVTAMKADIEKHLSVISGALSSVFTPSAIAADESLGLLGKYALAEYAQLVVVANEIFARLDDCSDHVQRVTSSVVTLGSAGTSLLSSSAWDQFPELRWARLRVTQALSAQVGLSPDEMKALKDDVARDSITNDTKSLSLKARQALRDSLSSAHAAVLRVNAIKLRRVSQDPSVATSPPAVLAALESLEVLRLSLHACEVQIDRADFLIDVTVTAERVEALMEAVADSLPPYEPPLLAESAHDNDTAPLLRTSAEYGAGVGGLATADAMGIWQASLRGGHNAFLQDIPPSVFKEGCPYKAMRASVVAVGLLVGIAFFL